MRLLGQKRVRELVQRFIDGLEAGDVDAILVMLGDVCDLRDGTAVRLSGVRGAREIGESRPMPGGRRPRSRRYVLILRRDRPDRPGTYRV